jgi:hypothetical protein
MNEREVLKLLGAAAGREDVPEVDVTRRVLAILREREEESVAPMAWLAGLSSVVAGAVVFMAFHAVDFSNVPFIAYIPVFTWVWL